MAKPMKDALAVTIDIPSDTESNERTCDEDDSHGTTSTRRTTDDTSTNDEDFNELTSDELEVSAVELTDSGDSSASSDEEDTLGELQRCHPKVNRNMSKEEFRDLINQLEPEEDKQLLYPPSLRDYLDNTSPNIEYSIVDEISEYQRQNPDSKMPDLNGFCVYHGLDHKSFPGQYAMLQRVALRKAKETYLLDAAFILDGRNLVLQQVELLAVEVSRFGAGCDSCEGEIWATIKLSPELQVRVKLRHPASQYQKLWTDFCWIVNFARYSVDYFTIVEQEDSLVALDDFKSKFLERISSMHGECPKFKTWIERLKGSHDVRRHLSQYVSFIYSHFRNTTDPSVLQRHPLWDEIGCIKIKKIRVEGEPTVVTQNVAAAFLIPFPEWATQKRKLFDQVSYTSAVQALRKDRMRIIELANKFGASQRDNFRTQNGTVESKVTWTLNEAARKNSPSSRRCLPEELLNKLVVVRQREKNKLYFDYALVTQTTKNMKSVRVVWLTLPSDTFGKDRSIYKTSYDRRAFYPIGNELFFSDDCNCYAVSITDIVGVYDITILDDYRGQPCNFFAIHQYLEKDQCIVKITESQLGFMCPILCNQLPEKASNSYETGCGTRRRKCRSVAPSTSPSPSMISPSTQDLTNVSLFTGCGLFDRALEASGGLHTILSIDSDPLAIRSAKANTSHDTSTVPEFAHGSVNRILREIMAGKRPYLHADCLSAGSPCPGFSMANTKKKTSNKSQRECSLVASVVAWVETILPGYVIIENVPGMDWGFTSACKQVIFCLLSFGYQVRKFTLHASEFGGSTIRERLFVVAAAPKYQLPQCPRPTHGVGLIPKTTIEDDISDLRPLHNDTAVNIEEPYHMPLQRLSPHITSHQSNLRALLSKIPLSPPGQGLIDIQATLTGPHREWFQSLSRLKKRPGSQMMRRVEANGFFRTIVTAPHPLCFHGGQQIHYDQHRLLSLEEVARAQGVPHDFVLLGNAAQKLRQVGNAVPWCFGEAIGREIAKARGYSPGEDAQQEIMSTPSSPRSNKRSNSSVDQDETTEDNDGEHSRKRRG